MKKKLSCVSRRPLATLRCAAPTVASDQDLVLGSDGDPRSYRDAMITAPCVGSMDMTVDGHRGLVSSDGDVTVIIRRHTMGTTNEHDYGKWPS